MATTVINIRQAPAGWQDSPDFVYIGRKHSRYGVADSFFRNSYVIDRDGDRDEVIERFIADWSARLVEEAGVRQAVLRLAGKTLVCWCEPQRCHGDWLAEEADRLAKEWDEIQACLFPYKGIDWAAVREKERRERIERERRLSELAKTAQFQAGKIKSFVHFQKWRKKYADPLLKEPLHVG